VLLGRAEACVGEHLDDPAVGDPAAFALADHKFQFDFERLYP